MHCEEPVLQTGLVDGFKVPVPPCDSPPPSQALRFYHHEYFNAYTIIMVFFPCDVRSRAARNNSNLSSIPLH